MEPTLAVPKARLEAAIGTYLGYGRGEAYEEVAWDRLQGAAIRDGVESGQRTVYFAAILPGMSEAHRWSFLRVTRTLTLAADSYRLPLPPDCTAGLVGPVLLVDADRTVGPIPVSGSVWRLRGQDSTRTGHPQSAQVEHSRGPNGPDMGQRFELVVWPVADAEYSVQVTYDIQPDAVTAENPFPYGGPAHGETFIQACVAAAELQRDGIMGPQHAAYMSRLATSISVDRRNKPTHYGYNADRSDGPYRGRQGWLDSGYTVTFDGFESG